MTSTAPYEHEQEEDVEEVHETPRSTRHPAFLLAGLVAILVALTVLGQLVPSGPSARLLPLLAIPTTLLAAAFASRTARLTGGQLRLAWSLLAVYLTFSAVVDVLAEGLVDVDLGVSTDVLHLAALVPGSLAMMLYPLLVFRRGMWGPFVLDATLLVLGIAFVLYALLLHPLAGTGLGGVQIASLAAYPLGSAWAAGMLLLVMTRSRGARRIDVLVLGAAFNVYTWGDIARVLEALGSAPAGRLSDVFYATAPLVLCASAAVAAAYPSPARQLRRHLNGAYAPLATDLFALVALASGTLLGPSDRFTTVLGLVTIVMFGVRQASVTRSAWSLRGALERRIEERTQELKDTTEHYERLDRMKREFITAVSHELRTPLAAIRGGLEMLEDGDAGELNPMARQLVETASRGSERLSRLVNDIIDLERLEGGVTQYDIAAHAIGDVVRDAAQALASLAAQHHIDVRLDVEEADVWCEPDPIIQVLVNLLGNAFKFSDEGTRVFVSTRRRGDEVVVAVRDQGRGIPEDELESIFERFHQIEKDDSREKGGAGLGLSICRLIVLKHGGRIWAESDDTGATFLFTLPVAVPTGTATATGSPQQDATQTSDDTARSEAVAG